MIHIIYVSSAIQEMSEEELISLLNEARFKNERLNITGMLLYSGGNFIQVLEGEQKDVEKIYQSILNDNRNKGHILIEKENIAERNFPNWSMGFEYLTSEKKNTIKGYSEFLERKMDLEEIAKKNNEIIDLLYSFKQNI